MSNAPHPVPRRAHAVEQDGRILAAARAQLIARRDSSMAEVAEAAGVGMSAIYSRFGNKQSLLRRLAQEGNALAATALDDAVRGLDEDEEPWGVFDRFVRTVDAGDVLALAALTEGAYDRDAEEVAETARLNAIGIALIERLHRLHAIRPGVTWFDLGTMLGAIGTVRGDGPERTRAVQARMLDIVLAGLRPDAPPLPGDAPEERDFRAGR